MFRPFPFCKIEVWCPSEPDVAIKLFQVFVVEQVMALQMFLCRKPFPTIVARVWIERADFMVDFKMTTLSELIDGKLFFRSADWANLRRVKITDKLFNPFGSS